MTIPQTSKIFRSCIKITSWNIACINNPTGRKTNDTDFTDILQDSDIICLQETNEAVELPDYRSFSSLRKSVKKASGGVVTLISNQINHAVSKVNDLSALSQDIIVVKLKQSSLNIAKDIYIVNVYIRPSNSKLRHTKIKGSQTFETLNTILNELNGKGEIILCGDFNARIQTAPDYIINEDTVSYTHLTLPTKA